ncbi:hypothetical protein [Streptococcus hyointestinalis]
MLFVYAILFMQADTVVGAVGSLIWIVVFGVYSQLKFRKAT